MLITVLITVLLAEPRMVLQGWRIRAGSGMLLAALADWRDDPPAAMLTRAADEVLADRWVCNVLYLFG